MLSSHLGRKRPTAKDGRDPGARRGRGRAPWGHDRRHRVVPPSLLISVTKSQQSEKQHDEQTIPALFDLVSAGGGGAAAGASRL